MPDGVPRTPPQSRRRSGSESDDGDDLAESFGIGEQTARTLESCGLGIASVSTWDDSAAASAPPSSRRRLATERLEPMSWKNGSGAARSFRRRISGGDEDIVMESIRRSSFKNDETILDKIIHLEAEKSADALEDVFESDGSDKGAPTSGDSQLLYSCTSTHLGACQRTTVQLLQEMTTSLEAHGSFVHVMKPELTSRSIYTGRWKNEGGGETVDEDRFVESIRTDTSWSDWDGLIRKLIQLEFPKQDIPTARRVINVGQLCDNQERYKPGSWVEIRGADMKWRLDMITRVVKQAPDDWDWNDSKNEGKQPEWQYYYHAGKHRRLQESELRSPEEGLRRVFGHRPWVWQQWACVKLERKLRFQQGHQNDCIIMDVQKYVTELWDTWLNDPRNADFKAVFHDERVGDFGRSELVNHIMKPFELMERIKEDKERWNFGDDESISVFTYLGMLGSGYLVPLFVAAIQIIFPVLLAVSVDGCSLIHWSIFSNVCVTEEAKESAGYDVEDYKNGTYHIMAIVIFALYFVRVVPDTLIKFYNTVGAHSTVYSRLLSLRQLLWSQRDDTFGQMLGYKTDIYMNTAYPSALYLLNVYIILHSDQVLDIILNSLAFEFIALIDEELTKSLWWDPEQRWITAGALGLVLQTTIQLHSLKDPKRFSDSFGIDEQDLLDVCNGDPNLLQNALLASEDANNTKFMSKDEIIRFRFRMVAHQMENENAIDEYEKPVVYFGILDRAVRACLRQSDKSMFNRFATYRTWSRWEHVLYMSPVPNLRDLFDDSKHGRARLARRLDAIAPPEDVFANYDPMYQDASELRIFMNHLVDVLLLKYMVQGLVYAWREKKLTSFLFRLVDGFAQWLVYVTTIAFPVFVLVAIFGVLSSLIQLRS